MILTLGNVMSRATEMAGGRGDWAASDASFWANVSLQEVAQRAGHLPKEAIAVSSTTSGEMRYALPGDFDYPLGLTLFEGSNSTVTLSRSTLAHTLYGRDANWGDARDLPDSGVPTNYVLYSSWFELYPSPTSAYSLQLRYMTRQATLVASTDTPTLDDRWHPAWLFKTVEFLEGSRSNVEGEAIARNRYLNYISTIPTDVQLKQRDRASMHLRFVRNQLKEGQ